MYETSRPVNTVRRGPTRDSGCGVHGRSTVVIECVHQAVHLLVRQLDAELSQTRADLVAVCAWNSLMQLAPYNVQRAPYSYTIQHGAAMCNIQLQRAPVDIDAKGGEWQHSIERRCARSASTVRTFGATGGYPGCRWSLHRFFGTLRQPCLGPDLPSIAAASDLTPQNAAIVQQRPHRTDEGVESRQHKWILSHTLQNGWLRSSRGAAQPTLMSLTMV